MSPRRADRLDSMASMRPPSPSGRASRLDDRTAVARIRDAAVQQFGREGFSVSLRAIAKVARVSHGLVVHHFGSKDGLRRVCDDYVLGVVRDARQRATASSSAIAWLPQLVAVEELAPIALYVIRSLQAGGDLASSFVEDVVSDAEEYLAAGVEAGAVRPSRDPAARARYLAYQGLGTLLLCVTLRPEIRQDFSAGLRRTSDELAGAGLELLTEGLFTDPSLLDAYLVRVPDPSSRAGRPSTTRDD